MSPQKLPNLNTFYNFSVFFFSTNRKQNYYTYLNFAPIFFQQEEHVNSSRETSKTNNNPEEGPKVDFSLANITSESRKSTITARKAPAKKSGVSCNFSVPPLFFYLFHIFHPYMCFILHILLRLHTFFPYCLARSQKGRSGRDESQNELRRTRARG